MTSRFSNLIRSLLNNIFTWRQYVLGTKRCDRSPRVLGSVKSSQLFQIKNKCSAMREWKSTKWCITSSAKLLLTIQILESQTFEPLPLMQRKDSLIGCFQNQLLSQQASSAHCLIYWTSYKIPRVKSVNFTLGTPYPTGHGRREHQSWPTYQRLVKILINAPATLIPTNTKLPLPNRKESLDL